MTVARPFGTVLVANRGEIAVRVLRACRELGLVGVAVYSEPDAGALHVREADRAVALMGRHVSESYLDAGKLLAAARQVGAEALHPGYGLLSESAAFARAVEAAGLVWVGPPADAIAQMGDKLAARRTVLAAGVEPVPGTAEPVQDAAEVVAFGEAHGWPVAIKAAAGGGGRGIRVVRGPDGAAEALAAASREAAATFGSGVCYLERFFERPRHVEVQVLADAHGAIVHLGERDCSVQRRHQKLVEETPSPGLPGEVRGRMTTWAVTVAKACGYVGAGTVEFLWDPAPHPTAWFLEMNTRLQVEHPVTEAVSGVDIVAAQLRIAAGEPLGFGQDDVRFAGHAIECRVNAEDPGRGFLPASGSITRLRWPGGPGVRVDAGYESGDTVSPFYDDLLGKVITWGRDRDEAIRRMRGALADLEVEGVAATTPALARIVDHEDFRAGAHWTTWLEEAVDLGDLAGPGATAGDGGPDLTVTVDGADYPVRLYRHRPSALAGRGGDGRVSSPLAGTLTRVEVAPGERVDGGDLLAVVEAMKMETPLRAPFAGTVVEVQSSAGHPVAAGQTVVIVDPD